MPLLQRRNPARGQFLFELRQPPAILDSLAAGCSRSGRTYCTRAHGLGFARAEVAAASELTEAQRKAMNAQLERLTGKRIRAHYSVQGALIGGVVVRIGSTVYNGSVRDQLDLMEQRLSAEN